MLDPVNPISDALETIMGTDVISEEKKFLLFQRIERLRSIHCPSDEICARCQHRTRCASAIADVLGS